MALHRLMASAEVLLLFYKMLSRVRVTCGYTRESIKPSTGLSGSNDSLCCDTPIAPSMNKEALIL